MAKKAEEEEHAQGLMDRTANKKNKTAAKLEEEMEGRLSGFEQFSQKKGMIDFDLLEKAAEEAAAADGDDEDKNEFDLDVDEDLFDDDDDDLDDLDFDSDDDEELDI
jgi:hypothetical protein